MQYTLLPTDRSADRTADRMSPPPDLTAVADPVLPRVARGDRTAVRECLTRYGRLVWAVAMRFHPNRADAEDAVQDVFIELWKHAGRFDPAAGSEATFVTLVARRRLIDARRRAARRPTPGPLPDAVPERLVPVFDLDARDEVCRARAAVAGLRDEQRTVILMAVDQGLTHDEIAAHTGLPVGTVKTHIRRGLIAVRERLGCPAGGGER